MADFVVVSTAVTDDITLANGTPIGQRLGGAGIYAFSGVRLWTEDVVLVTGVGEDFAEKYGTWFAENRCSMAGLRVKDAHTAVSRVQYLENGERVETPLYGGEHYVRLEATPEEIEPFVKDAKGVYIFKDVNMPYWENVLALKRKYGFALCWEINADAAKPELREAVREIASQCDVFSINRTEALRLFAADALDAAVRQLLGWNIPAVFLRVGGAGAIVLSDGQTVSVPCAKDVLVEDPTGAGNGSTGGFLYGWCQKDSAALCGMRGSVSAAHCITQYGPPSFTEEICHRAAAQLLAMQTGGKSQ